MKEFITNLIKFIIDFIKKVPTTKEEQEIKIPIIEIPEESTSEETIEEKEESIVKEPTINIIVSNQFKSGDIDFTYTRLNGKVEHFMIDKEEKLSKNFKVKEFLMKVSTCEKYGLSIDRCKKLILDERVVIVAQLLRDYIGKSLTVNSAYRDKEYNKAIGGSSTSQHLKGRAIDIDNSNLDVKAIQNKIKNEWWKILGIRGLETSKTTWLHIDFRVRNNLLTF